MVGERLETGPWRCDDGSVHQWEYLGKALQTYRCRLCQIRMTKAQLKADTDA